MLRHWYDFFRLYIMHPRKVLIIDDEKDFGFLLKNFFEKKKYTVMLTHTIKDGMEALEKFNPDYIFLDNNLPDGSGWGQTEFILANYPGMQLNLISAYFVPKTSSHTFRILEKPITTEDLEAWFKKESFSKSAI